MQNRVDWCLGKHQVTNHNYDKYLPYEFHLRMVVQVAKDFQKLLPIDMFKDSMGRDRTFEVIELACWGHDLIEDTRVSYNDCVENLWLSSLRTEVADIIYACTNEKGKNRKQRADYKYYNGIVTTPGAVYVKLCDRIANVQYSKMTKSSMFEKYKEENPDFLRMMGRSDEHQYSAMFDYLISLFDEGNIS